MSTITTRAGKGSPLTNTEVDANFTNLNTDKAELSGATFTGDVKLGDNDKATFGAGDDLQIYHNSFASIIKDSGVGDLYIGSDNNLLITNSALSEVKAKFTTDGAVDLYYDNAKKLATTSTGIDVTGTATMDGLTVHGVTTISTSIGDAFVLNKSNGSGSPNIVFKSDGTQTAKISTDGTDSITFARGTTTALKIGGGTGDISFYEDTGTTPKLFWDASAESLGIGTTTPNYLLDVEGSGSLLRVNATSGNAIQQFSVADTTSLTGINFGDSGSTTVGQILYRHNGDSMAFSTANTEAMRIDSSGNLLVGTTSVQGSGGVTLSGAGYVYSSRPSSVAIYADRTGSDGAIQEFRKNGTAVGSIGTRANDLSIGNGDTGLNFWDASNNIIPESLSAGAARDNAISLGASGVRFKDLHLSGSASVTTSLENGTAQFKTLNANVATPEEQFYVGNNLQHVDLGNKRGDLKFFTSTTEKMRLDTSGNLLVGTTSWTTGGGGLRVTPSGRSDFSRNTTSSTQAINFANPNGFVGNITLAGSTTTYNTSSDQRLKDNIVDAPSASEDIDAIQVRSFDWKADGSHQKYGMVAQELQTVAPEAVSVPEDSEEMMGVDYSKLVPMLIKEIQSLRNRVAQLEE